MKVDPTSTRKRSEDTTQIVWEEGGYESGPHLDEYGHPAWRWAGSVEAEINKAVDQVFSKVR